MNKLEKYMVKKKLAHALLEKVAILGGIAKAIRSYQRGVSKASKIPSVKPAPAIKKMQDLSNQMRTLKDMKAPPSQLAKMKATNPQVMSGAAKKWRKSVGKDQLGRLKTLTNQAKARNPRLVALEKQQIKTRMVNPPKQPKQLSLDLS